MSLSKSTLSPIKNKGVNEKNYSIVRGNVITYVTEYRNRPIICKVNELTGCHEITSNKPRNDGYVMCARTINKKVIAGFAHRVIFESMNGEIEKGKEIMHQCDNKLCCNPNHLLLGTHKENIQDLSNKGLGNHSKGHQRPSKVLSVLDIIFIKNNLDKYTDAEFSKMYGLVYQNFFYIRNGKNWSHISKDDDPNDPKFACESKLLTLVDIEVICSYKFTLPQLAEMYKCSKDSLSRIRRGQYPKYLQKLMNNRSTQ
jgi:hypothetical protein